jgi:hypothetical protein
MNGWVCVALLLQAERSETQKVLSRVARLSQYIFSTIYGASRPPLWSSGQSSWLQIRMPGFDSRHYQKKSSGSGTGSTQPREYN